MGWGNLVEDDYHTMYVMYVVFDKQQLETGVDGLFNTFVPLLVARQRKLYVL